MVPKKLEEITDEELLKVLKISGIVSKGKKTLKSAGYVVVEKYKNYVVLAQNQIYGDRVELDESKIVKIPYREHNPEDILPNNQFQVAKYLISQGFEL